MSSEQIQVLAILLGAGVLFGAGRLRADLIAVLVMLALALSGVSTPAEAVAGFGSTVVVMVGSLLVIGEALSRTGAAVLASDAIIRLSGGREWRVRGLLILAAALLGSVMSSTAVVALFLPVAMRVASDQGLAPSRLLLPLAYGALVSGMMTLIGTAPNLVVHAELRAAGLSGFRFFDFTPVGGAVLAVILGCLVLGARWLLPRRSGEEAPPGRPRMRDLWRRFEPARGLERLVVVEGSRLIGESAREAELGSRHGVRIVGIERPPRRGRRFAALEPTPDQRFESGDILIVTGDPERLTAFGSAFGLQVASDPQANGRSLERGLGIAEVMVHPESGLIGKTLSDVSFRTRHHLHVAGVRRGGAPLAGFPQEPLRAADLLLVMGPWTRIRSLHQGTRDFVLLTVPAEMSFTIPARGKLLTALSILAVMVAVSGAGLLPIVTCALAAAAAMVLARCITLADAYQSIHWGSLVLLAGMLPLASALDRTGLLSEAAGWIQTSLAGAGPRVLLGVLFTATALIGSFISNTATAVLMAPIALRLAQAVDVRPEAMAMAVAIASSSAFLTPVGSPVVTLVYEPGGYRIQDLLRAGLPVFLAALAICVVALPWLFPF